MTRAARLDDVRAATVRSLQRRLARSRPGSRDALVIEKAIDYALSSKRSATNDAFLEHDAVRNASVAVQRSSAAEARAVADIAAGCAPTDLAFHGGVVTNLYSGTPRHGNPSDVPPGRHTAGPAGRIAGTAIVTSANPPEEHAIAVDLARRISAAVRRDVGALGEEVLSCLLHEETVGEAAARLSVSTRTIVRLRAKVREVAESVVADAAA